LISLDFLPNFVHTAIKYEGRLKTGTVTVGWG
jgi:hypothetical protein